MGSHRRTIHRGTGGLEDRRVTGITKTTDEQGSCWRIKLDHSDAAKFDAALQSHLDALMVQWKHDHDDDCAADHRPPLPNAADAFMRLVEAARRPHGHRTTVVMHVDVEQRAAALHLGPLLSDAERRYLLCDPSYEAWLQRDGEVIGAGRTTRQINRRLRRALEHRHPTCVVPGCGATLGLHVHHLRHWEYGGVTGLAKVRAVCRFDRESSTKGLVEVTGGARGVVWSMSGDSHR